MTTTQVEGAKGERKAGGTPCIQAELGQIELVENKTVSNASAMVVRFFATEEDALFTGSEASQLPFTLTDEPPVESEV